MEDSMISTVMDKDFIEVMSTLIAKMDRLTFDENRTSVFLTQPVRVLFSNCAEKLMGGPFDVDEWYRRVDKSRGVNREIDPSVHQQPISTDWLSALMQLEMESAKKRTVKGSMIKVLHSLLELEDSSQRKLADYCKKDLQYDCLGIAKPAMPGLPLLIAAPRPPTPGGVEDLLAD